MLSFFGSDVVAVEKQYGITRLVLKDASDRKYVLDISEPLADPLRRRIGTPIRCHGSGTWRRTQQGWKLDAYKVADYTFLQRSMVKEAIQGPTTSH